jgi:hypothetical protein
MGVPKIEYSSMKRIQQLIKSFLEKKKEKAYLNNLKNITTKTTLRSSIYNDKVTFSHIGLLGDIIYSIPCMLALAGEKKIELYLDLSKSSMYPKIFKHYNENKILTESSITFIRALMLTIPNFVKCEALHNEPIDYDLNEFRKYPFDYRMGNISRWYFLTFGVTNNLSNPWLTVQPNIKYQNEIIIARSFRYRAPTIDYSFLQKIDNISFIGLDDEFEDMKKSIPNLNRIIVSDALALAKILAACKFFIGNQSFPFAVAEALKIKRVLEVCYKTPNVIVEGENAYDFCFQAQFEQIIKDLMVKM